jgi:hypothetical protein
MLEPIEDDTWVPLEEPLPPDLLKALQAAAHLNDRTLSEEFSYRLMVKLGKLRPSQTH